MSDPGAVSIVTGATRGIGRAVALALAARGRQVLAVGRDPNALVQLVEQAGPTLRSLNLDLTDDDAVERVLEAARHLGSPRELVCSAGVVHHEAVGDIRASSLREQLAVNLEAPLLLAQAVAARMREGGRGGAIVFVSSNLVERPASGTAAYAASKAALEAVTRGMALELAPGEVRVNAVAPGVVDTDMVRGPRPDGLAVEERLETLRGLHPLGRLGTPTDVADAVLYLLEASWVTGSILRVDGGLTIG